MKQKGADPSRYPELQTSYQPMVLPPIPPHPPVHVGYFPVPECYPRVGYYPVTGYQQPWYQPRHPSHLPISYGMTDLYQGPHLHPTSVPLPSPIQQQDRVPAKEEAKKAKKEAPEPVEKVDRRREELGLKRSWWELEKIENPDAVQSEGNPDPTTALSSPAKAVRAETITRKRPTQALDSVSNDRTLDQQSPLLCQEDESSDDKSEPVNTPSELAEERPGQRIPLPLQPIISFKRRNINSSYVHQHPDLMKALNQLEGTAIYTYMLEMKTSSDQRARDPFKSKDWLPDSLLAEHSYTRILEDDEIKQLLYFKRSVRKRYTAAFKTEGRLRIKYLHLLEEESEGRFVLPAVIIHTANPHMIETWLIKHVTLRYGKAYIDGALYKANDNNLSEPSTQTDQDEAQEKQTRKIAPRTSCTKFEQSRTREQKLEARLLQTLESTLKRKSEEAQELRARVRILENHFNQKSTENADFINSLGLVPTEVLVPHYILEDSTENESEERQGISDRDSGVESESQ